MISWLVLHKRGPLKSPPTPSPGKGQRPYRAGLSYIEALEGGLLEGTSIKELPLKEIDLQLKTF